MQENYSKKQKLTHKMRALCILCLSFFLFACDVELYQGLSEKQANDILVVLLGNNIEAHKQSQGKAGYAVVVAEENMVQALDLLNKRNLPQEKFQNLGSVFGNDGLVSSGSSERARMAFAISQELSETISRIDGVLTARVHIVLGEQDQSGKFTVEPSAAIFVRHIPDSLVVNYIQQLQSLAQKAIPKINLANISVMLLPVRETVSVPWTSAPTFFQTLIQGSKDAPLLMLLLGIIGLAAVIYVLRLVFGFIKQKQKAV